MVFTPALVADIFAANVDDITGSLLDDLKLDWGWGAYDTTAGVRRYADHVTRHSSRCCASLQHR